VAENLKFVLFGTCVGAKRLGQAHGYVLKLSKTSPQPQVAMKLDNNQGNNAI
jgi:hypothetical protein